MQKCLYSRYFSFTVELFREATQMKRAFSAGSWLRSHSPRAFESEAIFVSSHSKALPQI
jgi:hypothetical protein